MSTLILFALDREALYFRRHWSRRPWCGAGYSAWEGQSGERLVRVVQTGVGMDAAEKALAWALSGMGERPGLVIMAGFAGALAPELRVGDLVLGTEVIDAAGARWTCSAGEVLAAIRGRILSTATVLGEAADKADLYRRHQALAVEMESAGVARVCARQGIPFACLRAISDEQATSLPADLLSVLEGGQVATGRLLRAVLRRPGMVGDLLGLAAATRRAAASLSAGLMALLDR
jgi:adenosylhomocysteine nucleosidase